MQSNRLLTGSRTDRLHRAALAIFVTISIISVGTISKAATAVESRTITGSISVQGIVNVNGLRATEGQTLFAKSTIETALGAESLITLRNRSRVNLSAEGALTIESSERNLVGSMHTGRALLNIPAGVVLNFSTADLSINKKSVDESILIMVEATECAGTKLSVMSGQLEVHHNGHARLLKFGESLSTNPAQTGQQQQQTQSSWNKKKTLGVIFGAGGAVAILLAVALGNNDENQQAPGGGVVCAPSPGSGC